MSVIHGLNKIKGLNLFLHPSGGDVGASESIMDYLHDLFVGILEQVFLRWSCLVEL